MISMEKIDYKKSEKEFYLPSTTPSFIQVPSMRFVMVEGKGNPNTSKEYQNALSILYGISFTIKMSKKSNNELEGYFDYVVPPLEGLWWTKENKEISTDFSTKEKEQFHWISMIRQPDFVTQEVYQWAFSKLKEKKPELDYSKVRFQIWEEGTCAQIMHKGSYDTESKSIQKLEDFIAKEGYITDIGNGRYHHEIYLGDPRKTKPENLKTVIRHPIKRK